MRARTPLKHCAHLSRGVCVSPSRGPRVSLLPRRSHKPGSSAPPPLLQCPQSRGDLIAWVCPTDGKDVVSMPRMHPPYPERFRREAVELARKSGRAGSQDRHARSWAIGVVRARYSGLLSCMETRSRARPRSTASACSPAASTGSSQGCSSSPKRSRDGTGRQGESARPHVTCRHARDWEEARLCALCPWRRLGAILTSGLDRARLFGATRRVAGVSGRSDLRLRARGSSSTRSSGDWGSAM